MPITVAVALLLAALAISGKSRAGYLLGLLTAALMILAGVAIIALEIQYIGRAAYEATFSSIFIVGGAIWIALWALYGVSVRRARPSFAPNWQRVDRRFAIVMSGLVVFASAAYVSLGAVESAAAAAGVANRDQAEKLVQGTRLIVAVDTSAPGSLPAVQAMSLELEVHSLATYELAAIPTFMSHRPRDRARPHL